LSRLGQSSTPPWRFLTGVEVSISPIAPANGVCARPSPPRLKSAVRPQWCGSKGDQAPKEIRTMTARRPTRRVYAVTKISETRSRWIEVAAG
jgi:hypothetical protein